MMRAVSALVFLAVALLLVMGFQAAKQEMAIRTYITRLNRAKTSVQFNEKEIVATKVKLDALSNQLNGLKKSRGEIQTQIKAAQMQKAEGEKALKTCKETKEGNEKKKAEITDAVSKMRETQEAEKAKAQQEVQNLKQQILDRDKAVCAFVDTTIAEGKKLCGL